MSRFLHFKKAFALALFAGFYFLLAQSFEVAEIAVAVASALLALVALEAVARLSPINYAIAADWRLMRAASPLRVVKAAVKVLALIPRAATAREPLGRFSEIPISLAGQGPTDAARLGLATWAISLAPDAYVTRFDGDALVVHRTPAGDEHEATDA